METHVTLARHDKDIGGLWVTSRDHIQFAHLGILIVPFASYPLFEQGNWGNSA